MGILVVVFEIIGTIAFSISGAIIAMKKKMDLLGVLIMGLVTAVGGGIVRDILLGQLPPRVFLNGTYPLIAMATALAAFILVEKKLIIKHSAHYELIMLLMDSIGLGVFTVVGIEVSQNVYGIHPMLNLFMGVITGVGGGVIRDVFSCEIPYIFTRHFYATASIIGAAVYILLWYILGSLIAGISAMLCIVLLRVFASKFLWNLPKAE